MKFKLHTVEVETAKGKKKELQVVYAPKKYYEYEVLNAYLARRYKQTRNSHILIGHCMVVEYEDGGKIHYAEFKIPGEPGKVGVVFNGMVSI